MQKKLSILKEKITLTNQNKQLILSVLIIISLLTYVYGYRICLLVHNTKGFEGQEKKQIINLFWDLRFALYSVIICIIYFISKFNLNIFNKSLINIGFNFALISSIDKLFFNIYDGNKYDRIVIFSVILFEILYFKIKKNKEKCQT